MLSLFQGQVFEREGRHGVAQRREEQYIIHDTDPEADANVAPSKAQSRLASCSHCTSQ